MSERLEVSDEEFASVSSLNGPGRYRHFVKRVVDWESIWGLWDGGWVAASDDHGVPLLPLWPARRYAETLAVGDWAGATPRELDLDECVELLERISANGMKAVVFMTSGDKGIVRSASDLISDLQAEGGEYDS